jgi:hypothetical protein
MDIFLNQILDKNHMALHGILFHRYGYHIQVFFHKAIE